MGSRQRQRSGDVAQLEPRQRRGEQDEDVAAAGGRDVRNAPAAEPREQLLERRRLAADLGRRIAGAAGRVEVERQHPRQGSP